MDGGKNRQSEPHLLTFPICGCFRDGSNWLDKRGDGISIWGFITVSPLIDCTFPKTLVSLGLAVSLKYQCFIRHRECFLICEV